jgi:hypothetical protein
MRFLDQNVDLFLKSIILEKLLYALSRPALVGSWNSPLIGPVGFSSRFAFRSNSEAVQKASDKRFSESPRYTFSKPLWRAARYFKQLL